MRTCLVTGGNRGIGLAIVKGLAHNNDDQILLGCRNIEQGEEIAKAVGTNVIAVKMDLSDRDVLTQDIKALLENFPTIDVLVNNAGILIPGDLKDTSLDEFEKALRVNTLGPYQLMKELIPLMISRGYGRVVNMSSGWGAFNEGLTGPLSYSVSKASLNALTMSIAKDLPKNVKVNSMCPGWVRTDMGGPSATRTPTEGASTALWLANLKESGPSGDFFRDEKPISW